MDVALRLLGIEKNYGSVKALKDVNLEIVGGKTVALLGINGAGKTTLLRIIAGLEKQDKGYVFFNGKMTNARELRQIGTLVFQKTAMFSRSVYDNLAYGLKIRGKKDAEIKWEITQALQAVGLRNFEKRRAKRTSGGEQQRLSLARAFLLDPQILLLDEPTANLDPNSATIIERAIMSRTKENCIIILATHNLSQAKRLANEVVHIYDGKIVEIADPEEFFTNPRSEITRKFIKGELDY
ncbi:MAG TPA: phosphate ABC transporter ATP-binding protein [Candidatus Acidoferrum sp.]|nr:phosphate ABC transporter ATP-binding protein [Candidatus Acidoferrum sp.]